MILEGNATKTSAMGEITNESNDNHSPSAHDDPLATGNGQGSEARGVKRSRTSAAAGDDDDDDDDKPGRERRKIDIKFIQDKSRRHITFSKRKAGIMKKVRLPPIGENVPQASAAAANTAAPNRSFHARKY